MLHPFGVVAVAANLFKLNSPHHLLEEDAEELVEAEVVLPHGAAPRQGHFVLLAIMFDRLHHVILDLLEGKDLPIDGHVDYQLLSEHVLAQGGDLVQHPRIVRQLGLRLHVVHVHLQVRVLKFQPVAIGDDWLWGVEVSFLRFGWEGLHSSNC